MQFGVDSTHGCPKRMEKVPKMDPKTNQKTIRCFLFVRRFLFVGGIRDDGEGHGGGSETDVASVLVLTLRLQHRHVAQISAVSGREYSGGTP